VRVLPCHIIFAYVVHARVSWQADSLRFLSAANDMWDHRYWIRIIKNNGGFVKLHPKVLVGL
jgi:hypothetical protein